MSGPHTHIHRNAGQILRYLDAVLPQLEPSGGIPETPMNRKERGASRPPVPEHILSIWQNNPHAGRINQVLREAAHSTDSTELAGRPMWEVLGDCLFDHTAIRRWKAQGGVEMRRLWMMCRLLAQRLSIRHDRPGVPYEIFVTVRAQDEQAASFEQGRSKDANEAKTHNAHKRYRNLSREMDEIMAEEECGVLEAVEVLNRRRQARKAESVSWATIKRARAFVRGKYVEGEGFSRMEGEAS